MDPARLSEQDIRAMDTQQLEETRKQVTREIVDCEGSSKERVQRLRTVLVQIIIYGG